MICTALYAVLYACLGWMMLVLIGDILNTVARKRMLRLLVRTTWHCPKCKLVKCGLATAAT